MLLVGITESWARLGDVNLFGPPLATTEDLKLILADLQTSLWIKDGRITEHRSLSITSLVMPYFNNDQWTGERERGVTISTKLRVLTLQSTPETRTKVS